MIRTFALVFGIIYVLVGILGFVPGLATHTPDMQHPAIDTAHGYLLGLFPINLMHNLVHIAIGAWGILSSRTVPAARTFGRGLAIIYALLAILGFFPGTNMLFGLAPIHGHDIWLHAGSALVAAYFGFIARESDGKPIA